MTTRKRAKLGHFRRIFRERKLRQEKKFKTYINLEVNSPSRIHSRFRLNRTSSVEFSNNKTLFQSSEYYKKIDTLFHSWESKNKWKTIGATKRKELLITLVANLLSLPRTIKSKSLYAPLSINVTESPYLQETVMFLRYIKHINFIPGYRYSGKISDSSKIYPTTVFDAEFPPLDKYEANLHITLPYSKLVRIKRDNKHIPLSATNRKRTQGISKKLEFINRVNLEHHIVTKLDGKEYPCYTRLNMIFKRSLERGGRIYALGNSYQNDCKEHRQHIHIDDEPTVELDYSGHHPRMLYANQGMQYEDDLYDLHEYLPEYLDDPSLRILSKLALLVLINAEKNCNIPGTLANEVWKEDRRLSLYLRRKYPKSENQVGIYSRIVEAIKQKHILINHYFHSDSGARLQKIDGKMALEICYAFARRGIPILPVHDSFIVAVQYREERCLSR